MTNNKMIQKKCVYCTTLLGDNPALDVCKRCGHGIWGERMFNAITENMETAKEKGDLDQGSVGNSDVPDRKNNAEVFHN